MAILNEVNKEDNGVKINGVDINDGADINAFRCSVNAAMGAPQGDSTVRSYGITRRSPHFEI